MGLDTQTFFQTVLPDDGQVAVVMVRDKIFTKPRFFADRAAAARAVQLADAAGWTVYFGCSSYVDGAVSRSVPNVHEVRAFWLDLDCGEGKPYPDKRAALVALGGFIRAVMLPRPLVVDSGAGIHVYWIMDAPVPVETWRRSAEILKAACQHAGLAADAAVTADAARILRPVGTTNRKRQPFQTVRALSSPYDVADPTVFQQLLSAYILTQGGQLPAAPSPLRAARIAINDELLAGLGPKSDASRIAERCATLRYVRDNPEAVSYPLWYAALGVLAHVDNGPTIAHEWSKGHPKYTPDATNKALDNASGFGATTCSRFAGLDGSQCEGCPVRGNIKTPWSLGMTEAEATPSVPVENEPPSNPDAPVRAANILSHLPQLPGGYRWAKRRGTGPHVLEYGEANSDGHMEYKPISDTLIYPLALVDLGVDDHSVTSRGFDSVWRAVESDGTYRDFNLAMSLIGVGGAELRKTLGHYNILLYSGAVRQMEAYLTAWVNRIKTEAEAIQAFDAFGWHKGQFVIGPTIIDAVGARPAYLRGSAQAYGQAFEPKGDLTKWVETVDRIYNHPGQEGYQFMILCGFAAPLFHMFGEFGGITAYAHSEGSGVGKTTAQRVAMSAWGDWDVLQQAEGKTTMAGLWEWVGLMRHLPIMYDELTNLSNKDASEIVFSFSSGRNKLRCEQTGALRSKSRNWSTIVMASGNNMLTEKLSLHRANAEAEISRLFEYTLRAEPVLKPNDANALFPVFREHYGHAGRTFASYVAANYHTVRRDMLAVQQKFNDDVGITQRERYWSALAASVLMAGAICKRLQLLQFNLADMRLWLIDQFNQNRAQLEDSVSLPLEQFGVMLADLWPGILVTLEEGDLRTGNPAFVQVRPHGPMVGRVILPPPTLPGQRPSNTAPTLLISQDAVKTWCNKKGVSAKEMLRTLVAEGLTSGKPLRYSLGKGTMDYAASSSYVQCWKVDASKIAALSTLVASQKLTVVGGQGAASP